MAKTYWLSFRLRHDSSYADRYDNLVDAVKRLSGGSWWVETSAFAVFMCELEIDSVASLVNDALDPSTDVALLGMSDFKSARVLGASIDPDIYTFMPFARAA
jgi:hypothetical protein